MREKILLFSGLILILNGSVNIVMSLSNHVFAVDSISQLSRDASIQQAWTASVLTEGESLVVKSPIEEEQIHTSGGEPSFYQTRLYPAVDKDNIDLKHRQIVDEVMRLMPERCAKHLQNFYVRYDDPGTRGLGGKTTIILSGLVSDEEFRALFVHEFGHLMDLGCMTGDQESGTTPYKDNAEQIWRNDPSVSFYSISWRDAKTHREGTQPEDFVSGYASWDMFEDFAESITYYVLHREAFAVRATENSALAAKYLWFQQNLPRVARVARSNAHWDGSVPWDSTKLSYEWDPPGRAIAQEQKMRVQFHQTKR